MNLNTLNDIASELFAALVEQKTIQPLTDKYPEMDISMFFEVFKESRKMKSVCVGGGGKCGDASPINP